MAEFRSDRCRRPSHDSGGTEIRPRVGHAWSLSTRVTTGLLCSPSRSPFLGRGTKCAEAIAADCTGRSDLRLAMANAFVRRSGGRKQSAGDDWLRTATCLGRYQVHRPVSPQVYTVSGFSAFRRNRAPCTKQ